ncbi:octopamine receptor beta-2R-like [Saccoglossus kowalevskii]
MDETDNGRLFYICVLCLTLLLSILGNLLVLTVTACSRKLHTVTTVFIINLAIGDLGITTFVLPFSIHLKIARVWIFGHAWCQIVACLSILFYTISMSSLALVSVERFIAINLPLQYTQKMKCCTVRWMIAIAWIYAIVRAACPLVNFGEYYLSQGKGMCAPNYPHHTAYTVVVLVIGLLIPSTIMCYSYANITKEARKHATRGKIVCDENNCTYVPNRTRENRAAKILAVVTGVFFICWIPYTVSNAYSCFVHHELPYHVDGVTQWLTFLNSAINPWMHSLMNRSFRISAVKLWQRTKLKCSAANEVQPAISSIELTESVKLRTSSIPVNDMCVNNTAETDDNITAIT